MFIGYAIILPGNQVLPLAGIINYSIAVGGLLLTGGNLARMLILGIITMPIYLYGATYLAPILSDLAEKKRSSRGNQERTVDHMVIHRRAGVQGFICGGI